MSGLNITEMGKEMFNTSFRLADEFCTQISSEYIRDYLPGGTREKSFKTEMMAVAGRKIAPVFAMCGTGLSPEIVSKSFEFLVSDCWPRYAVREMFFSLRTGSFLNTSEEQIAIAERIRSKELTVKDYFTSIFEKQLDEKIPAVVSLLQDHQATVALALAANTPQPKPISLSKPASVVESKPQRLDP